MFPTVSPFDRLWLCETLRLREAQAGPLDDEEANRQARAAGGALAARLETRALWLARRDGLLEGLRHWRQGAQLAALLLGIVALFAGAGLAFAALGDGRQPVNVFWALGSLLGLNLLSLAGWLLSLVLAGGSAGALGRLWLWSSVRLARDGHAAQLAPALLVLLRQQRLARWLLGLGVHALWLAAMASALLLLTLLLATRRYGFVWETTLLGEPAFVALTHGLGRLPGLLGFSVPSAAQIAASGQLGADPEPLRQVWAQWLLGVTLVYGLLPRLLLTIFCAWRWQRGRARLQLDTSLPAYRLLAERLCPSSERLGISDPAPPRPPTERPAAVATEAGAAVLVAIELDDRRSWPPVLPPGIADAGILDDRAQRRQTLEQLGRAPAARLLIACEPLRSPDRGTLALIGELARSAGQTRLWLLPGLPEQPLDAARLADWRDAVAALGLAEAGAAPLDWLEHGHA